MVELIADAPLALSIPPGVAHGFYFDESSLHVYAVSHEWDPSDELGCRWDDPDLGIAWPCSAPLISGRDRSSTPQRPPRLLASSARSGAELTSSRTRQLRVARIACTVSCSVRAHRW